MRRKLIVGLAILLALAVGDAQADRRKLVWTYQYGTMASGSTEMEFYQTVAQQNQDKWEYRIELEHGLTANTDLAVYEIFSQTEGSSLRWDAVQVRLRTRLAEQGELPLDPLLYIEYARKASPAHDNKAELKLVLSHDFSRTLFALNPVFEGVFGPEHSPEYEVGLDLGLAQELSYTWSLGVEMTGRREFLAGPDETSTYLGPTASYASGEMFLALGYGWGISEASDPAKLRAILGVGL